MSRSAPSGFWLPPSAELPPTCSYERSLLVEMYRRMRLIRDFELRVNELFLQGRIPGTIHLSHGQEATTVGACFALDPSDVITMTHRAHGQALAKGVTARALMAELLGKSTGCSGGKGGSLHVGDPDVGALTAIAIVGASSPIAVGLAFAYQRRGNGRVALNFIGDGTANKGEWHEAMNLAALWDLPVIFLCENNFYASTTNLRDVMRNERVAERAAAYHMPGITIYGNEPLLVYETVAAAVHRARDGDGPSFIECLTYRIGGHKRDDPGAYRPPAEVASWLQHDPLPSFRVRLLADDRFAEADLAAVDAAVLEEVEHAVVFAQTSPYPDPESALDDVYS